MNENGPDANNENNLSEDAFWRIII